MGQQVLLVDVREPIRKGVKWSSPCETGIHNHAWYLAQLGSLTSHRGAAEGEIEHFKRGVLAWADLSAGRSWKG